jgi:hypothetical protein
MIPFTLQNFGCPSRTAHSAQFVQVSLRIAFWNFTKYYAGNVRAAVPRIHVPRCASTFPLSFARGADKIYRALNMLVTGVEFVARMGPQGYRHDTDDSYRLVAPCWCAIRLPRRRRVPRGDVGW